MLKFKIIHIQEVDSTNTYLKKLAVSTDLVEGTVILADCQTDGRGQGANTWISGSGLNITMSLLLFPGTPADRFFTLNELVSLAIADTLIHFSIPVRIKWPNDIYVGDKKIAGILIENTLKSNLIVTSVVGIGLNVNQNDFPDNLPNPVSMSILSAKRYNLNEVLKMLLQKIYNRYKQAIQLEFETLHHEYNSLLYCKDHLIEYATEEGTSTGRIIEVSEEGELIIEGPDGKLNKYIFGEIKFNKSNFTSH